MKLSTYNFWRDVALIIAVAAVVNGAFSVLLHTYYSDEIPVVVQDWAPVGLFVIGVWFLIDHRIKNPPKQDGEP
ncbi:MAG TPA: hypothetical protein VF800_30750 [Telluria sp.]|jgi:putative Ca2+/H+ antiporter (TMEM165/GDT1 family)